MQDPYFGPFFSPFLVVVLFQFCFLLSLSPCIFLHLDQDSFISGCTYLKTIQSFTVIDHFLLSYNSAVFPWVRLSFSFLFSFYFFYFFVFVFQAVSLNENKKRIFEYVESRMTFIAPNLSIMVGASVAAKLMGQYTLSRTRSKQSGLSHQNYFFLFKFVLRRKNIWKVIQLRYHTLITVLSSLSD